MSVELRIGERVVVDLKGLRVGGSRFQHGVIVNQAGLGDDLKFWVSVRNGPVVQVDAERVRRSASGLLALEAIPAGSAVEIDAATGNVRRAR